MSSPSPDPGSRVGRNLLVNAAAADQLCTIAAEAALVTEPPAPFHQLPSRGQFASFADSSRRPLRGRNRLMNAVTLPLLLRRNRSYFRVEVTPPRSRLGNRNRLVEFATPSQHSLHSLPLCRIYNRSCISSATTLAALRTWIGWLPRFPFSVLSTRALDESVSDFVAPVRGS